MVSDRLSYVGPVIMIARRWSSGFDAAEPDTSNVAPLIGHIPRLDLAEAAKAWILRSSCKAQQKDYSLEQLGQRRFCAIKRIQGQ